MKASFLRAFVLFVLLVLAVAGCASASAEKARDTDALVLQELSGRAAERAAQVRPEPVLRQLDVIPSSPRTIFYFTDPAATIEISVDVPSEDAPASTWKVRSSTFSKLVGFPLPGLDMASLNVGAAAVGRALQDEWPGCSLTSLTLYREGDELQWTGFCRLPDGALASGTMDNHQRKFQVPGPPAFPPATALPE